MAWSGWKRAALPSAAVVVGLSNATAQDAPPAAPPASPSAAEWHDAAAVQQALKDVAGAHKDFARAGSYGKSLAGRDLGYLELGPVDDPQKGKLPALLIVAGLDGQH